MTVAGAAYADPGQFEHSSEYFDARSRREAPTWLAVDVRFQRKFKRRLALDDLRGCAGLSGMLVLRRGNRLSVTPLTADEAVTILDLTAGRRAG
jgi:predicted RNA-binding protein with PUA-like domain